VVVRTNGVQMLSIWLLNGYNTINIYF